MVRGEGEEGEGEENKIQSEQLRSGQEEGIREILATHGGGDTSGRTNLEQPGLCSYIITPSLLCHF